MGLATACRPWRGESVRTADREQNCRAGASPADLWNGKRERLPYKSVIGRETNHHVRDDDGTFICQWLN